jgi:hypothetical protein
MTHEHWTYSLPNGYTSMTAPRMSNARRDTSWTIYRHVKAQVDARLVEIGDGLGCEAAAARAFEQGRLAVVEADMWNALGLPGPSSV